MKAIILAAGYATRLYPLTKNFPKPLLLINNKPIIEYIIEKLIEISVTEIFVVTNNKFYSNFLEWSSHRKGSGSITVVNDNTNSNDDRLGAIGDFDYVIRKEGIQDDILIIGGDNLFRFSLKKALDLFRKVNRTVIVGYDVKSLEQAKKFGVIDIAADGRVQSFVEKPEHPKSTFCAICVYFYPKSALGLIDRYIKEGNSKDAPGNLPAWLVKNDLVYAVKHDEEWFDIGGFDSLNEAKRKYGEE